MHPDDAVRQLEYAMASRLDDAPFGHWDRQVYGRVFEDVAERGASDDVRALVGRLCDEFEGDRRPTPEQARRCADRLLTEDGRRIADGGER